MIRKIVIALLIGIVIPSIFLLPGCQVSNTVYTTTEFVTRTLQNVNQLALPSISDVVAVVKPAVVSIDTTFIEYDFFGRPIRGEGAGSGWIIDSAGYIVTNNHVIDGAETINITLQDNRVFQADAISTDSTNDLAIIKIDANGLPTIPLGDSSALAVGDWLVAIGNSFGMGTSATVGIVSALDVSLSVSEEDLTGLIQTDTAINPGNSGGPLVNMAGEVIGINSVKIQDVGVEGMGYAISINKALPVLDNLCSQCDTE